MKKFMKYKSLDNVKKGFHKLNKSFKNCRYTLSLKLVKIKTVKLSDTIS